MFVDSGFLDMLEVVNGLMQGVMDRDRFTVGMACSLYDVGCQAVTLSLQLEAPPRVAITTLSLNAHAIDRTPTVMQSVWGSSLTWCTNEPTLGPGLLPGSPHGAVSCIVLPARHLWC